MTEISEEVKAAIEKCMATACLQYQDLLDQIPTITEELQFPVQLARQAFDSLCHRKVFGEEFANAAKQDCQPRKRDRTDAESSEGMYTCAAV